MPDVDAFDLPPEITLLIRAGRIRDLPRALAELGLAPPVPGQPAPVQLPKLQIRRLTDEQVDGAPPRT